MTIREIRRTANMSGFGRPESISGVLFGGEALAHKFIITDQSGDPYSGSVTANFLRMADDATVPITGAIENGAATVTLLSNCYRYPGRFKLTIYLVSGTTMTAIYSCIGSVDRTDSDTTVDPGGEITINIQQLISEVETAEAGRASAESARQTAESGRVSAENGRVSAESGRASAESGRASAETARESASAAAVSAANSAASSANSAASAANTAAAAASAAAASISPPNLLDNWYMVYGKAISDATYTNQHTFPINQRSNPANPRVYISPNGYALDRWQTIGTNLRIDADRVYVETTAQGNNGATWLYQILSPSLKTDTTYTISALVRKTRADMRLSLFVNPSTAAWSWINDNTSQATTEWQLMSETFTAASDLVPGSAGLVTRGIGSDFMRQGDAIEIKGIKLEIGSKQTLAHNEGTASSPVWVLNEIPDYETELAKCIGSKADSSDPYTNFDASDARASIKPVSSAALSDLNVSVSTKYIGTVRFDVVAPATLHKPTGFENQGGIAITQLNADNSAYGWQIFICDNSSGPIQFRILAGGTWGSWSKVALTT